MPQTTIDRDDAVEHVVAMDDIAALLIALSTMPTISSAKPRR
jgi:hypothetical protein